MTSILFKNTVEITDYYIDFFKNKIINAIDMTIGHGNDIYKIAKTVNKESEILGFDISEIAVKNTKKQLEEFEKHNIKIIRDSHENINRYTDKKLDLVIYNLGYLPKGDKNITTDYKTVIKSLEYVLSALNENGIIIMTFYPGHNSGKLESIEIEKFLSKINQKKYNILKYSFINQINNPPYVVVIERLN
ncbi:tRNA (mnm(5)s(2)U34)-methyltransferase [Miniphocaeibacter halophilus]|uniref:Class I SAM-dependent methyltransferase n=1 Tax=Miniphocaeibacter halophilus TaxID=2931922 RepID=A0AC61MSZ8_9FIRM|nr:class I SAM-dependent methyltransferase [Miniphocaeibacter halophilus]QQK07561.1 class I SAM-dependent methyltransferase [Miniphocaeibacter halophilus]